MTGLISFNNASDTIYAAWNSYDENSWKYSYNITLVNFTNVTVSQNNFTEITNLKPGTNYTLTVVAFVPGTCEQYREKEVSINAYTSESQIPLFLYLLLLALLLLTTFVC